MKAFILRFGKNISGVLHGFDRIRFRGTRRFLANVAGMMNFLWHRQVLLKDFKTFAGTLTAAVRQAAEAEAAKHPALPSIDPSRPTPYYWSMDEGEWASDLAFASAPTLADLAPRLFRHAWSNFGSADVMRFLGNKAVTERGPHGRFAGEVVSDLKRRLEGMRIKHRLNGNWIKMYDKQGSVLRVETVINQTRDMKVFRAKEGDEDGAKSWQRLRKGVADVHRRAPRSARPPKNAMSKRWRAWTKAVRWRNWPRRSANPSSGKGQRARALNPLAAEDGQLLEAVNRGEFAINGMRNRDLRGLLYTKPACDEAEDRRRAATTGRKLRLLRAHGLIHKIPKTHRYQLSPTVAM